MYDPYLDVLEKLERQLLSKDEPPSHVTAARQFIAAKIEFTKIVRVNPEAILYVDKKGVPMTAWAEVRDGDGNKVTFYRQTGFPAFPSPYLKDTG